MSETKDTIKTTVENEAAESPYVVYRVGGELYSSPLLSVREVLEYQKPKFMPNMVSYFSGVINVRGTIVGVVDLRRKLGVEAEFSRKTAMLLIDTDKGPMAAVVDSVENVIQVGDMTLEKEVPVRTRVSQEYFLGIARREDQLITVMDLHKLLHDDELKMAV